MHVVALTRLTAAFEADQKELASWISLSPYDFGLRVRAGLPALLGGFATMQEAESLVTKLRARGYGAVRSDSKDVAGSSEQRVPRDFHLTGGVLAGVDHAGKAFQLQLRDVVALIRATSILTIESNTTVEKSQFAIGRALATGGVVMKKKVAQTNSATSEEREQVLYLFGQSGQHPLLFRETRLHYQGLGAALKPVASQNFATLIQLLRAAAPHAFYDERFLKQKRKASSFSISAVGKDLSVASSNTDDTDLAAHLLVLAHDQNQL
jgi:hypothetical protein